jgi:hypothetical protein
MRFRRSFIATIVIVGGIAVAQLGDGDQQLARLLADDTTREKAVEMVVAGGAAKVPLLLSWTRNPPPDISEYGLYIGLAETFGRLKAKESIPFLIKNIAIQRWPASANTWMKTPEVIEERMPAVAALIHIGPEALNALVHAPWRPTEPEDRLAGILVVSRIAASTKDQKASEEARAFLQAASGEANMQRFWAEFGLKLLEK